MGHTNVRLMGETRNGVYGNPLYYHSHFSVNLKLVKLKIYLKWKLFRFMIVLRRNVNPNVSTDKALQTLISKSKIKKTKEINPEKDRGGDRDWEREHIRNSRLRALPNLR